MESGFPVISSVVKADISEPQCLQNLRPEGLGLPQVGQGSSFSVDTGTGAAFVSGEVPSTAPHERQNLLPGLLPIPQCEQAEISSTG